MRIVLITAVVFSMFLAVGCDESDDSKSMSHKTSIEDILVIGDGMVDDREQRVRRITIINDQYRRQFVDDWDYLTLYERNCRLTQWHPRTD